MKRAIRSSSVCVMRSRTARASSLSVSVCRPLLKIVKQLSFSQKFGISKYFFISFVESLVLTKELCHEIKEFKQQRRQLTATATKTSLKLSKYTLHRTFSRFFFFLFQYVKCWQILLEFNS